jgi:hypothetical protein
MNLRDQLLLEHSKSNTARIVAFLGRSQKRYRELWELVKGGEHPIPQRGSWVLDESLIAQSKSVERYLSEMIAELAKPTHDAVKRHILRILIRAEIPEDSSVALFDQCLFFLSDPNSAIALKVFGMEIATRTAMPFPELREEVAFLIQEQMKPRGSMAILSRGKRLLKRLEG